MTTLSVVIAVIIIFLLILGFGFVVYMKRRNRQQIVTLQKLKQEVAVYPARAIVPQHVAEASGSEYDSEEPEEAGQL